MLDSILLTFSKVKRIWNIFIYSHKEHKAKKKKKNFLLGLDSYLDGLQKQQKYKSPLKKVSECYENQRK